MKKEIKTNMVKVTSFLLIFVLIIAGLNGIMRFKYSDGIKSIDTFYELDENTVDVLILGSSHAFSNFRPNVIWDEYGYSSYILSASVQPVWNSYYYLEEALKTQTPKVIVFEGYRLVEQTEFSTPQREIKSTYGLKFSPTKIKALKESFNSDDILEYAFQFGNYHSRYIEISRADYSEYYDNIYYKYYKGEINQLQTYDSLKKPDVDSYNKKALPLAEKTEKYYRKMIELAKENNIPFITIIAPYNIPQTEYRYFKYAENIAKEYDVPFININENYDSINLDFKNDIADDVGHLNNSGAEKLSSYLGQFLKDNYDIPDHRNDEKYESWQIHSKLFERLYYSPLKKETNLVKYMENAEAAGDYSYLIMINDYETYESDLKKSVSEALSPFAISDSEIDNGVYLIRDGELQYSSTDLKTDKAFHLDSHTDIRVHYGEKMFIVGKKEVFYANINNKDDNNARAMPLGVTIIVYDDILEKVLETVYCQADSNGLSRKNELIES